MCGFSTRLIENSVFAIFTRYDNFASTNRFQKSTASISTVPFTLCPIRWRDVMKLINNYDNQNWQAKSLQMRYNLSKLEQKKLPNLIHSSDFSYARSEHFWHFVLLLWQVPGIFEHERFDFLGFQSLTMQNYPSLKCEYGSSMYKHGFETLWIWALNLILIRYDELLRYWDPST